MLPNFEPLVIRTRDFLEFPPSDDEDNFDETGQRVVKESKMVSTSTSLIDWRKVKVCMNDHHPFDGETYHIPVSYDKILQEWEMDLAFCSLSCAKRVLLDDRRYKHQNHLPLFTIMCYQLYGVDEVVAAPPPMLLSMYYKEDGVGLSIEKYRDMGKKGILIKRYNKPFKMAPVERFMVKLNIQKSSDVTGDKKVDNQDDVSEAQRELFRMSPRTASAKRKPNPLFDENCKKLGITNHPKVIRTIYDVQETLSHPKDNV